MTENRLGPAEIRRQQEERQQAERLARAAAEKTRRAEEAEREGRQVQEHVERLRTTWRSAIEAAAEENNEIRFLVLAEVLNVDHFPPLAELVAEIQRVGFRCRVAEVSQYASPGHPGGAVRKDATPTGQVYVGRMIGWKTENVPAFGPRGFRQYLIVEWDK